jgi:Domain of unknown function (DUF4123)
MSLNAMSPLLGASAASTALWALVDPALCPESWAHYSTRGTRHVLPLPGLAARSDDTRAVIPFLARLSTDPLERQQQLAVQSEWALQRHGVSWLQSDMEGGELAKMLGRRMDVTLSDKQAALVRLADARVLPVLHSVLSQAQRLSFFGLVSRWSYFDRQEQLTTLELPSSPTTWPTSADDPWVTPWALDPGQESALLREAESDTVIALLRDSVNDTWSQVPRAERHALVCRLIARAKYWGIDSAAMQAAFCTVGLHQGEAFGDEPAWRFALEKVRSGSWGLPDAIESVLGRGAA